MGRHSKEFNDGYQAAIEAIKQAIANKNSGSNNGNSGDGDDMSLPSDIMDPESNQSSGGSGSQSDNDDSNSGGSQSRTRDSADPSKTNHGEVRPEDCVGPSSLDKTPGNAGGMIDRNSGDDIVEQEGYTKEGGSEAAVDREWKDARLNTVKKLKYDGSGGKGDLVAKLENICKVTTDWKKELRSIVGHAISPDDKRQAYANKNVLVSQDRIARTDKDKYDAMSYMVIILDTSGSMWNDKIRQMMREAYAVALQKKPMRIVTIQNDTDIQEIQMHNNMRDFERYVKSINMKGGGGNDLSPVWAFLRGKHKKFKEEYDRIKRAGAADVILNFTDGFLKQLKRDPITMKNLVWCIVDNPGFELEYKDMNTKRIILKGDDK